MLAARLISLSFVAIGLFLATAGHSIGLDADRLRYVAAGLVVVVGGRVGLLPPLQTRLAAAAGPIGNWADGKLAAGRTNGLAGQFWIGFAPFRSPYGVPSARTPLSEPRRFSPHRERTSSRLRLQCSRSASGRRFRFWGWGGYRGKPWCDGAAQCCRPAAA